MSKPFNFYGQNSGVAIQVGQPTNFTFFFLEDGIPSGVYLPPDFIGSSFSISITNDSNLFPISTQVQIYGDVTGGENLRVGVNVDFYGDFYPNVGDTGVYSISQSGNFTGQPYDNANINIVVRGDQSGILKDSATWIMDLHGQQLSELNEYPNYYVAVTGNVIPNLNDFPSYSGRLHGAFKAVHKDISNVDFVFASILYESGGGLVTIDYLNDTGNLDYLLTKIVYTQV